MTPTFNPNHRRGTTVNGIKIEWRRHPRTNDVAEHVTWSISCGAWAWESEPDFDRVWTWDRVAGLATGLAHIADMGPDGAAALAATLLRNMEPASDEAYDNVIPLRRK